MSAKETWINKTMESIEAISPLNAPSNLVNEVMTRLSVNEAKVVVLRPQFAWAAAAGIALLVCINTVTLVQYNKSATNDKVAAKVISTEYFSYTEQF